MQHSVYNLTENKWMVWKALLRIQRLKDEFKLKNHRATESFRLENTSEITESNL